VRAERQGPRKVTLRPAGSAAVPPPGSSDSDAGSSPSDARSTFVTELPADAFAVDVVDTTAAGDACCGALCARLAAGDDVDTALRFAMAAGALATTVAGAVPSLPRRAEIDRLRRAG